MWRSQLELGVVLALGAMSVMGEPTLADGDAVGEEGAPGMGGSPGNADPSALLRDRKPEELLRGDNSEERSLSSLSFRNELKEPASPSEISSIGASCCSTALRSPMRATSTRTFLLISEGSISMWSFFEGHPRVQGEPR